MKRCSRTQISAALMCAACALLSVTGCKKPPEQAAAGSAGSSGSAGSAGSAATATTPDAAPPPVDAAPPPVDAAPADPIATVCPALLAKIEECVEDPAFTAALLQGANAKEQKKIKKLIAEVAEWPVNPCQNLAANYEFTGFFGHWDEVSDPAILETCAKLGAAVKAAGGLFGGDQAM